MRIHARIVRVLFWAITLAWGAVERQAAAGTVELLVRGPDAKPLANAEVELTSAERSYGRDRSPSATAKTDGNGKARFSWPVGVARINVIAKGVGYGTTGAVEVPLVQPVVAPLPPLAPFAVIEGLLPEDVRGGDVVLKYAPDYGFDNEKEAAIGADGRFRLEVPAGRWFIWAAAGKAHVVRAPGGVLVVPGQKVNIKLEKVPPEEMAPKPADRVPVPPERPQVTWAHGTVRDELGKPIPNAKVYAVASYHGGMRMLGVAKMSSTDAAGRYVIKGDGELSTFSASLIAHAPGHPPARAWIDRQQWERDLYSESVVGTTRPTTVPTEPVAIDLVLANSGGELEVLVVQDGRPREGTPVVLSLQRLAPQEMYAMLVEGHDERAELDEICHPVKKTDKAGIARFTALAPGVYEVFAAATDEERIRNLRLWERVLDEPDTVFGAARGVAVRLGETTRHRISIFAQPRLASVRLLRPDGRPVGGEHVGYSWGRFGTLETSSSAKPTNEGVVQHSFESSGLWQVVFRYRDTRSRWMPIRGEPFYELSGAVAVSPTLQMKEPVDITAIRHNPGTLVVELRDAGDKPAPGVVEIHTGFGDPMFSGSTNDGIVRFEGVQGGKYMVRGCIRGQYPLDLGMWKSPLPETRILSNRLDIQDEPVNVTYNAEQRVVLRQRAMGYVRGKLRLPASMQPSDFAVWSDKDEIECGASIHYHSDTGEFVAGPFAPGTVRLYMSRNAQFGEITPDVREVGIRAGEVSIVELTSTGAATRPVRTDGGGLVGAGGMSFLAAGAEELSGGVFHQDGKTPAQGAMVLYVRAGQWQPTLAAMADAAGTLRPRALWFQSEPRGAEPPGSPKGPVIVALLPGMCGATVIPVERPGPVRIILPPPIKLAGTVTIAGAAPSGRPGKIRVLAGREGMGKLNSLLSVDTTASEDGSFGLAGLTPGAYKVQAALDDIWLSPSMDITVPDNASGPIRLNIPQPGGPVAVRVVDNDGKPVRDVDVTVIRPSGPLAEALWPNSLKTDGAGQVVIPALEAGKHKLRIGADAQLYEIDVGPLPANEITTVRITHSPRK